MHVVVVAYGPRAVTRSAVGRVRGWGSLVSTISVVSASPAFTVAPGTFDAVRVADAEGTAGVHEAAGDEPVLVLHDDVHLDATGAHELVAGLDSADFVLAENGGSPLGFACFAARSLAGVDTTIVIPGARPALDAHVVPFAGRNAKHDHSCRSQLVTDRLDPDVPLLVASMIVRDEEERLPDALASVTGLVDRIDICDTGSTDSTMDVIRRFGGRTREIVWRNDFGWARNEALSMCRDATYALVLDADERIVVGDPSSFRSWLRTWSHEFDAITVTVENDRGDGPGSSCDSIRIARPGVSRYDGAVHEMLTVTQPNGHSPGRIVADRQLSVVHLGYRTEIVSSRHKRQRNIDIARAAHNAAPTPKTAIDLARSLLAVDPGSEEAAGLFDAIGEELGPDTAATTFSYIHASRAQNALLRGDHELAFDLARRALERTPNEDIALATAAASLIAMERHEDLVAFHDEIAKRPPGDPLFSVPRNVARYHAMVGSAHVRTGQLDRGVELLERAMAEQPSGSADVVTAAVPEVLARGADPSTIVPLVSLDPTGQVASALATQVSAATTASVCLAALMTAEPHAPVAAIQLSAALISRADDLAEAGLAFADLLDDTARRRLIDLARRKDRNGFAERLASVASRKIGVST